MVTHILRAAAEQSEALGRGIYVMRVRGVDGWVTAPYLACPCCYRALVAGRRVIRQSVDDFKKWRDRFVGAPSN